MHILAQNLALYSINVVCNVVTVVCNVVCNVVTVPISQLLPAYESWQLHSPGTLQKPPTGAVFSMHDC